MAPANQRIGYHYYPDAEHYTARDLETWLPVLKTLGAHWLTLRATPSRAILEALVRGLKQAGIEPVIHISAPIGAHSPEELTSILPSYARWGVRYVVVFDRPNMQLQRGVGLRPVPPPLEPGGDYWDTAFLEAALGSIARRGSRGLLDEVTLSLYAWTGDRALDWGAGGPAAWPETKPYYTPEGSQDQRGFRIFDWYSAISQKAVERVLPMLVLAGGATEGASRAKLGPSRHVDVNISIARAFESDDLPNDILNFNYFLLAADENSPEARAAWFPANRSPRPVVGAMQDYLHRAAKRPDQA